MLYISEEDIAKNEECKRENERLRARVAELEARDELIAKDGGRIVADGALHRLWSNAVGQPGYDKADWMKLYRLINEARAIVRAKDLRDRINRGEA